MENITVDIKVAPELRRIDDLGRVVIPKRIREMLKIDEGDMLEECVVNVEGKSSYGVLITPMREKNPEERLLKKLLPYMRILTKYVPAECRVAYVTADGTPKISYFELGYSPDTSLKSLYQMTSIGMLSFRSCRTPANSIPEEESTSSRLRAEMPICSPASP